LPGHLDYSCAVSRPVCRPMVRVPLRMARHCAPHEGIGYGSSLKYETPKTSATRTPTIETPAADRNVRPHPNALTSSPR